MDDYKELLKDPRWQKMRLQVFERDQWTCKGCGSTSSTLHVHHLYYRHNCAPWEYPIDALKTLCDLCHQFEEHLKSSSDFLSREAKRNGLTQVEVYRLMLKEVSHG